MMLLVLEFLDVWCYAIRQLQNSPKRNVHSAKCLKGTMESRLYLMLNSMELKKERVSQQQRPRGGEKTVGATAFS